MIEGSARSGRAGPAVGDVSVPVEIRSALDGSLQRGVLRLPGRRPGHPVPLIIAPHPFGWTVEEDYHGGYPGLRAESHRGWLGVPTALTVAVFQPDGHHRAVEHCSLGYAGVVRDVAEWIDAVDDVVGIERDHVYAGGLSMGALEAVLMIGSRPAIFAGGFAINPVFDVEAWYSDLTSTPSPMLRDEGNDALIAEEVGGPPDAVPSEYAKRSAFSVLDGLRRMPLAISWSDDDLVVPHQATLQGKRLYDDLKRLDPSAPVIQRRRRSAGHDLDDRGRWAVHETADYRAAAAWLLDPRRRASARCSRGTP